MPCLPSKGTILLGTAKWCWEVVFHDLSAGFQPRACMCLQPKRWMPSR